MLISAVRMAAIRLISAQNPSASAFGVASSVITVVASAASSFAARGAAISLMEASSLAAGAKASSALFAVVALFSIGAISGIVFSTVSSAFGASGTWKRSMWLKSSR